MTDLGEPLGGLADLAIIISTPSDDAPFFADIDRRSIKPDLSLNKFLLEAAARTAAYALEVPLFLPISWSCWWRRWQR
jgi:hypothetical protein